jgi:hypothetical protein
MEDALLFQLRNGVDKYMHQATLLEDAMAGAGTKDYLLVSRIVRFRMFTTPPFLFSLRALLTTSPSQTGTGITWPTSAGRTRSGTIATWPAGSRERRAATTSG